MNWGDYVLPIGVLAISAALVGVLAWVTFESFKRLTPSAITCATLLTVLPPVLLMIGLPFNSLHPPRPLTPLEEGSEIFCIVAFVEFCSALVTLAALGFWKGGLHRSVRVMVFAPLIGMDFLLGAFACAAATAMLQSTPWL